MINRRPLHHDTEMWVNALKVFLNWPEKDVLEWAKQHECDQDDESSLYYAYPQWYRLIPLLIPPSIKERYPSRLLGVVKQIDEAISPRLLSDRELETFDWQAAAARINEILKLYGESLETIRKGSEKGTGPIN